MWYKSLIAAAVIVWSGVAIAQTATPSDTPTSTPTVTRTFTRTSTVTLTSTVTSTSTRTATGTKTPLSEDTATKTSTSTRTSTPTSAAVSTQTSTRTRTITPTPAPTNTATVAVPLVGDAKSGCVVLGATPQALGGGTRRRGMSFWPIGGSMWCGYNFLTVSRTPGPNSGGEYSEGMMMNKCECQDKIVYCIGDNTVKACFDECADNTPTPTATASATPT